MVTIKSGLEIHQQLDTHKLFCKCPSVLRNDYPDFEVIRRLHAVAGETGEIDVAAAHEVSQDKTYKYQGYDTTCLVELDEEPPHFVNNEALEIALHTAMLLNCKILPITQIMRKMVIDGSNTSGFQRTVLIAQDGYIETSEGKVGIENVSLEEDAARIVDDSGKSNKDNNGKLKIFRLDRLGIPLVEIGTYPDINSPEQARDAALKLGDILRSCKVKRGIGTIRQDINISIEGHPRIEIKGFQDVKMFVPTILKEIERQQKNLRLRKRLVGEVRNALTNGETEFLRPMPGSFRMYPETDLPLLRISRDIINKARESLPKLRSEVKKELEKKGLSEEQIMILLREGMLEEFSALLKLVKDANFIFKVLIEIPKEIISHSEKSSKVSEMLNLDVIESIVLFVKDGKIEKNDTRYIMGEIAIGKRLDDAIKIDKIDLSYVESEIVKLIKEKPGLSVGGYMGLIMKEFKGKVSGKDVNEILRKLLK